MTSPASPDEIETPRQPPSLAERLIERARQRRAGSDRPRAFDWRIALAIAALIWLGPLATMLGAHLLAEAVQRDAQALAARLAPRTAAREQAQAARARIGDALRGPGPAATAEALARALPPDARIARIARAPSGEVDLEVTAPDPDQLRAALRRAPGFARMRDVGQQAGDGGIVSRFRIAAP